MPYIMYEGQPIRKTGDIAEMELKTLDRGRAESLSRQHRTLV